MSDPVGLFIDYETVASGTSRDVELQFPGTRTRYRTRPRDRGCLHTQVVYGTVHRGMVDVACVEDGCSHTWYQVKVREPA